MSSLDLRRLARNDRGIVVHCPDNCGWESDELLVRVDGDGSLSKAVGEVVFRALSQYDKHVIAKSGPLVVPSDEA